MKSKITKDFVNKIKPEEKVLLVWDTDLKGFGLKVTPAGSKVYVVQYRNGGRGTPARRFTLGKHGALTPEDARKFAKRVLGDVAKGIDPQSDKQKERMAITLSALCDDYLENGCSTKKESTLATDKGRIERHIKPLLGNKRVKDISASDVSRFMRDIANGKTAKVVKTGKFGLARVTGGKGTAARTVGLLGGIMTYAKSEGLCESNPVIGVKRYKDKKGQRFLSSKEMEQLGESLVNAEELGLNPMALNIIRVLLLTGCRRNEIASLTWDEIDFDNYCLRLKDSKTGQKVVPLGGAALKVLASIVPISGDKYVFPSTKVDGYFVGTYRVWLQIRKMAGLDDVRLHDLRHSFASVGAASGMGLVMVGKILGHADPKTTAQYAHIADDPARAAADRISNSIAGSLLGRDNSENVVTLKKRNDS